MTRGVLLSMLVGSSALAVVGCTDRFGVFEPVVLDAGEVRDAGCVGLGGCELDGACLAVGALDPDDPCSECRAGADGAAMTDVCGSERTFSGFEHFSAGDFSAAGRNLYATASGSLEVVRSGDLDEDGYLDIVVTSWRTGSTTPPHTVSSEADLFFGGPDRAFERVALPVTGSRAAGMADVDHDGTLDLVVARYDELDGAAAVSSAWMLSAEPTQTVELESRAAIGVEIADLDRDGWLDVVFADATGNGLDRRVHINWGGPTYDRPAPTELRCENALGVAVADLDGDGAEDVVCLSRSASRIFFGGRNRAFDGPALLSIDGGWAGCVADLNRDDQLDLVVVSRQSNVVSGADSYTVDSAVLYGPFGRTGSRTCTDTDEDCLLLPTTGASACSIGELDQDGWLDLVISQYWNGSESPDSVVYYGQEGGFRSSPAEVPSIRAVGNQLADFDRDGFLDLLLLSERGEESYDGESYLYWGRADGTFSETRRAPLDTRGPGASHRMDFGNVYDREPEEVYVSTYLALEEGVRPSRLSFAAHTPNGSSVVFQLRSGVNRAGVDEATFEGPDGAESYYERPFARIEIPDGHTLIQYRAVFRTPGFVARPRLDSVTVISE